MACVVFFFENAPTLVTSLDNADTSTLGRHPESDIVLTDPSVSTRHAIIKHREKGRFIQDLDSSNGTRVNGAEIEEALLNDGDRLSFGDVQGVYYEGDAPDLESPPKQRAATPPPPTAAFVPGGPPVGSPSRRSAVPKRSVARQTPSSYPDDTGSGCITAAFLTGLFIVAFFLGLAIGHNKETDRNLPSDLIERITRSMPKVKIEQ